MPKKASQNQKFAVIRSGGKQYRVQRGDIISVDRLLVKGRPAEKKEEISFEVLLIGEGDKVKVGKPIMPGKKVKGRVLGDYKEKKVAIVKFKPKKRYLRKKGYRATKTKVKIINI